MPAAVPVTPVTAHPRWRSFTRDGESRRAVRPALGATLRAEPVAALDAGDLACSQLWRSARLRLPPELGELTSFWLEPGLGCLANADALLPPRVACRPGLCSFP